VSLCLHGLDGFIEPLLTQQCVPLSDGLGDSIHSLRPIACSEVGDGFLEASWVRHQFFFSLFHQYRCITWHFEARDFSNELRCRKQEQRLQFCHAARHTYVIVSGHPFKFHGGCLTHVSTSEEHSSALRGELINLTM